MVLNDARDIYRHWDTDTANLNYDKAYRNGNSLLTLPALLFSTQKTFNSTVTNKKKHSQKSPTIMLERRCSGVETYAHRHKTHSYRHRLSIIFSSSSSSSSSLSPFALFFFSPSFNLEIILFCWFFSLPFSKLPFLIKSTNLRPLLKVNWTLEGSTWHCHDEHVRKWTQKNWKWAKYWEKTKNKSQREKI